MHKSDQAHFKRMRDEQPVWFDSASGMWNVYRYEHAANILSDSTTFSSDFASVYPDRAEFTEGNILAMDPPRHNQLRALVSQAFTPRAVAALEPRIHEVAGTLIDTLQDQSQFEFVGEFAYPLPVTVIAELLGIPPGDRVQFKAWADALLDIDSDNPRDEASLDSARTQIRHFHDYLHEHVAQRRTRPTNDLISDLVGAELDGVRLDDSEIVGFATILLLAGHITTTLLLGNALLCLDEIPEIQSWLRECPPAIPTAIEEVLRYRGPVPRTARIATQEVRLSDQLIAPRQMVLLWLESANHDERQFAEPNVFRGDRHPNPHLAFGKGIHYCLGAPLARLEGRIALELLLQRFAHIQVDSAWPLDPYPRFNGMRSLHLCVRRSG